MDNQLEIQKQYREKQEKYTYYIIGLCVASIAFSINLTMDAKLLLTQIPLGLAILAWGMSTFFGLQGLGITISALWLNNILFDVANGKNEISGNHPEKIQIGMDSIRLIIEEKSDKLSRFGKWQYRLFIIGIILFIIWRILDMYQKTQTL